MSLEYIADHLAAKGRGPDDTLVHMSRDEVKSLNELAMANGGQLTINPQTGLPEAGFLSSLLPMVAGAALASTGVGAPMAAMLVGGGSYLMNPQKGLMGGLMAGLGAYGGYGLGEGLGSIATSEAGATAGNAANVAAEEGAKQEMLRAQAQAQAQKLAESKYIDPNFLDVGGSGSNFLPTGSGGLNVGTAASSAADQAATIKSNIANEYMAQAPIPRGFDAMQQGAKSLFTDPTADKFKTLGGGSYMGLAKTGLAAAAPVMGQQTQLNMPGTTSQKSIAPRYKFNPGMVNPTPAASATGVENTYFNPQYTAISDEEAKSMYGYAGGGPVEAMSNANAIGANTGFPQAYLHNNAYATPYQTPISQNVLMGAGDVSVDPYTGEQRMADGGVSYDPQTQRYAKGISEALRPENRDVNIYNDTGGIGSADGPSSSGSPSNSTGQGVSNAAQSIGLGMMGIGEAPGLTSAIAGAIGEAIADSQTNSMSNANAAMGAANAGGHTATSDANGNISVSPGPGSNGMGSDTAGDSGGDGGAPGMGGASGGLSPRFKYHMATGGISDAHYNLGGYSDGGRLLRGPGDGVSDSIPAMIGKKQPARLADGEFVVPARIVSELGNGSTEAGARRLYAMMDRIQAVRSKTVGKGKVAKNTRADKYLPA